MIWIMLKKLKERAGFQGPALNLLQSYLGGRQQKVRMRGKASPPLPLTTGVPQGSVLGPLLFSLSVCDLKENFTDIDIVQYADDCTLLIPVPSGQDATAVVQRYVQRFVDYCAANRIAAEPEKTQLLHIRATRQYTPATTFDKVKERLPGKWRARSADFEIPPVTVGPDLVARFEDGEEYPITENSEGGCAMLEWTVSSVRKNSIYWRDT